MGSLRIYEGYGVIFNVLSGSGIERRMGAVVKIWPITTAVAVSPNENDPFISIKTRGGEIIPVTFMTVLRKNVLEMADTSLYPPAKPESIITLQKGLELFSRKFGPV